jgi:hypothetical protein
VSYCIAKTVAQPFDDVVSEVPTRGFSDNAEDVPTEPTKQLVRDLGLHDYWRKSGRWGDFARPVGNDDFEIYR